MSYPPFASDDDIRQIGEGFADRTLPKARWTHAGHFAAALWLMRHRPDLDLGRDMPGMIRAYNEAVGGVNSDTEGYHETITQASLRAARAFLDSRPAGEPLVATVNALMAGGLGRPDWLAAHYSHDRLFSVAARRGWVEPDLAPL